METIKKYIETQKNFYEEELIDWLRIPSISTLKCYKPAIQKGAEQVKRYLISAGLEKTEIIPTAGNPLVYGEKSIDPKLPTILVYGHYDVQPADPLELWDSPPFEPSVRDGKIYARGSSDDKCQVFAHIKAVDIMQKTTGLHCNTKFLIEGEEEIGSPSLHAFLQDKKNVQRIASDIILVSDTALISMNQPSLAISLRGIASLSIKIQGPSKDLHSGVYGGAVPNPIQILCNLLSELEDKDQVIKIPGFYDDVKVFSQEERKRVNDKSFDINRYRKQIGISATEGERGYTTSERTGIRPCLDINGIWGGYMQEGQKTVLPATAYANVSMRLVANQDPSKILQACTKYLVSLAPKSVKIDIKEHAGRSKSLSVSPYATALQAACHAFKKVWGKTPIFTYEGGSIPILSTLQESLGVDVLLMGFGLDTDNIHSPNEHFGLKNFYLAIETIITFYSYVAKLKF